MRSTDDRFWAKVNKTDGCWLWTACTNWAGYGKFYDGNSLTAAHRYSYLLHNGQISDGQFVLHHCDTPACVRPDHLFIGSQQDNITDMMQKKRNGYTGLKGERNCKAKLDERQVKDIRAKYESGIKRNVLALEYGMEWTAINRIIKRLSWKHVA